MMRFVWFWTFWHWSSESFRTGCLLHSPVQGVGTNWDEWFHHEASEEDRRAMTDTGRSETGQREFITWLYRHWAREQDWSNHRMVARFVIGQLAHLPPFGHWVAFEKYRTGRFRDGISSLVLAEGSSGEVTDVRPMEALVLPKDHAAGDGFLTDGFQTDREDIESPRLATISLLRGKGLLFFLILWMAGGRRPYPLWLKFILNLGWLLTGGLILYLLCGPDPREQLPVLVAILAGLWGALMLMAVTVISAQAVLARRAGEYWFARLEENQVRLRMEGGLTLKGASAGLPFCLNALLSLYRAWPEVTRRSWLWRSFFHRLNAETGSWAATGVITPSGFLKPVVLEPKIRAAQLHDRIRHVITPRQCDAREAARHAAKKSKSPSSHRHEPVAPVVEANGIRLGYAADYAAEKPFLRIHACRHAAQSLLAIGALASRWQMTANICAVVISLVLLAAVPDLRAILMPYPS
ncbi:MAG TPA: hypothetical protein VNZ25_09065, partial [Candidatus Angelobacter sp.]|nr:hypothetical protein [Candidatus Angelobacter sp.]